MLFVTQRYHGEGCFFKQKKKMLWKSQIFSKERRDLSKEVEYEQ